jgi:hypothetical protein
MVSWEIQNLNEQPRSCLNKKMSVVVAMASMNDSIQIIQSIVNLRVKAPPSSDSILTVMRSIEPLLNPVESGSNWRRGVPTGTNPSRRIPSNGSLNSRWKSSTGSLNGFQGNESPGKMESPIPPKYESKFRNSDAAIEDTILNTIIMNKLNKFSESTYRDIRDFLYQILDSGETDFIKEFMRLVFKKAAAEEIFCPLYAKLLAELRATYPVIQTEMIQLFDKYLMIFQNLDNNQNVDYQSFVVRNSEKKYRLGYSQFLAELVILEAVDMASLEKTFCILAQNILRDGKELNQITDVQESADCLLRMSRVFHKKNTQFFQNLRKCLFEKICPDLELILNTPKDQLPSLTPKSRFALMDVRDNLKPL